MIKLEICNEEDYEFVYDLIFDFFKLNLNITYMKMETFDEFTKRTFVIDDKNYIIKNKNNEKVGYVHIMKNNEIGYFVVKEFQNQGIGTDAVKKIMEINPREQYFVTIHNENKSSTSLAKKFGFMPKGTIYEKKIKGIF
jgi:RimJ/RimL family protein N-acetyltransferase